MGQRSAEPKGGQQTGGELFQHEIEELEQPIWRESRIHPLIVIAAAGLIALSLGAAFLFISSTAKTGEPGKSTIMSIEIKEPRNGQLLARPTQFAWESIGRTKSYVFTLREKGGERDLIVRETTNSGLWLTSEEASSLVMGGSYIWRVRARSDEGWTIGEGGGGFTL
jgi:hypothetical protein